MLTEYHTHEIVTATERILYNALKFGTSGEVDSKEGRAEAEWLVAVPPNCNEVETPQGEIDGVVGEALVTNSPQQRPRTKLVFDVRIDDQFLD